MNFHGVERTSLTNGDGIRCVLWVSGCSHHCKGCQNPDTWNPDSGKRFYAGDYWKIQEYCENEYVSGLTLSGGDPMYPGNRQEILALCKMFKEHFGGSRTIWLYTGYTMSEILDSPILDYVDVVVDGEYVEEQRNINRQWCGSENQRVWRKIDERWCMEEPKYAETIEQGECGADV